MMVTLIATSRCLLCGCFLHSYAFPSVRVNRRSLKQLPGVNLICHPGACPECQTGAHGSPPAPYAGEMFTASPWRLDAKSVAEVEAYRARKWPGVLGSEMKVVRSVALVQALPGHAVPPSCVPRRTHPASPGAAPSAGVGPPGEVEDGRAHRRFRWNGATKAAPSQPPDVPWVSEIRRIFRCAGGVGGDSAIAGRAEKSPDCPLANWRIMVNTQEAVPRLRPGQSADRAPAVVVRDQFVVVVTRQQVGAMGADLRAWWWLVVHDADFAGRCGISSMSPTNQRANFRSTADRLESGSARLTASSSRSHRSSSSRIRRNGVPSGGMVSPFLSLTVILSCRVDCGYIIPYTEGHDQ